MESVTKMFVGARESLVRRARGGRRFLQAALRHAGALSLVGQTMTEYALILAAIASWCTAPTAPWETTSARSPMASIPLLSTPENPAGEKGRAGIILETGRT
jgi:hypothetical protein